MRVICHSTYIGNKYGSRLKEFEGDHSHSLFLLHKYVKFNTLSWICMNFFPITNNTKIHKPLQSLKTTKTNYLKTNWKHPKRWLINANASCIDPFAISSNLPIAPRQRAYIPHIYHGLSKGIKELTLAAGKLVYNGNGVSPSSWKQLLISLQKPSVVLKVCKVVIVKAIWSRGVEIRHNGSISVLRARSLKGLQVCCVDGRIRTAWVVKVVKAMAESSALGAPKCMCTYGIMQANLASSEHYPVLWLSTLLYITFGKAATWNDILVGSMVNPSQT